MIMMWSVWHYFSPVHPTRNGRSLISFSAISGLRVLYRDLMHSDITIKVLELSWNNLTRSSSSLISDITIHCRVEELVINCNSTIGEEPALYNMLSHLSSRQLRLYILGTRLTAASANILLTALGKGNKLQQLNVSNKNITDEVWDVIATILNNNASLVRLWLQWDQFKSCSMSSTSPPQ